MADTATKKTSGNPVVKKTAFKKICPICRKEKTAGGSSSKFYKSSSPLYPDGVVPICIDCVKEDVLNENGTINETKLKIMCQKIDKPFYTDDLDSAFLQARKENSYLSDDEIAKDGNKIISLYFKNLGSLRQNKDKSYADSEKEGFTHQKQNYAHKKERAETQKRFDSLMNQSDPDDIEYIGTKTKRHRKEEKIMSEVDAGFEVTQDMIDLFGDGYTKSLYKKMYDKYEKLKINYSLQTNIHQEALATYVRFKVQEEIETAKGNVTEAKKWYDAATNAAQDAKLTPKQLTKADLDSGVNSISELTKAIEQAVDVIKILPRFKYRPNDAPDFNIWCYVDYERKLTDQPPVSYEDIYSFYDKRKQEYISQNGDPYGIFDNDPTENNRDTVKTFITLPDDYDDLSGESNDD